MGLNVREGKPSQPSSYMTDPSYEHLLCDVVHKIKNGLGGIGGFAGLLDRDIEADDKRKRLVRRIQEGVLKVNDIVVSLMILVRNVRPMWERIPIRTMINDVWDNYWFEAGSDGEDKPSVLDKESGCSHVITDPQLFQYLIYHSLRFIDLAGGRIDTIRWQDENDDDLEFQFRFQATNHFSPDLVCSDNLTYEYEPLEARLSLAIAQKISNILKGRISVNSLEEGIHEFRVKIQKGQIDL